MDDTIMAEPWVPSLAGGVAGWLLSLLVVIVVGFARPARKATGGVEAKVGAASLIGGAFATLGKHPGAAAVLVVVGAIGSVASDLIGYLTSISITNIVWLIVNSLLVFYWHRSVLKAEARAVGFDVDSGSFVAIIGRSWLVGLLMTLLILLASIPTIAAAASGVSNPIALAAMGAATGLAITIISVWGARFVLSFPATSIRQPEPGVWEMHPRAKGLGVTITAAISTILFFSFVAFAVWGFVADILWSVVAPEEWEASIADSFSEVVLNPPFRLWQFVLFDVPLGFALALSTILCISAVSIAYRRWILPEYAARTTTSVPGTAPGDDTPLVRI